MTKVRRQGEWIYSRVGDTEMRGRLVPSGIDIEQVSPKYNKDELQKAVDTIEGMLKEPKIELGKPMTPAQEARGQSALAAAQLEEDAKVSTIDRLVAAAPESLDEHTLNSLRQNYNAAIKRAESCEIKEMVGNLLLFASTADEIVDEMSWALRKDVLQSSEYDTYVRLLGLFERRTVPNTIKKILLEECDCGRK